MAHLFDQPNINETVTWQSEPAVRGTFSILATCTMTIILSIWSVVNLNLPRVHCKDGFENPFLWVVGSLFMPESSVILAWKQRKAASRVQKKVDEVFRTHVGASVSYTQFSRSCGC
jgi:hypothetical protein